MKTGCGVCQSFRRYYLHGDRPGEVKLEPADLTRICKRVVDHAVGTKIVAKQFGITRRRVRQFAKDYRETGGVPELKTPETKPYTDHPEDLAERVLELHRNLDVGAAAIAHILRTRDGVSIANTRVHAILQEHDHVTENPNDQGRRRPWVRFERDHSLVTDMDWYQIDRDDWVVAIEDDASRFVLDMSEPDARSATRSVELLDEVRPESETDVPILEIITDHASEFINSRQDDRPSLDHDVEDYLHEHCIERPLCQVGRPQTNGKLERFYQTYEKQRWRFETLKEFLHFYNEVRPHMSLL